MRALYLVLPTVILLGACSDPKKANESNFKKAIQAKLDKDPAFIANPPLMELEDFQGKHPTDERLDALESVGLVSKSFGMVDQNSMSALLLSHSAGKVPGVRYEFTDKARPFMRAITRTGKFATLTYADKEVVDIIRYSEPSAAFGQTISEVTYSYKLVNIADWARNPAIEKLFFTNRNGELDPNAAAIEAKQGLVLMSDGWRAPNM